MSKIGNMIGPAYTKRAIWIAGIALGLGTLALYIRTLAPGVAGGDAGELQFVPYILSLAHPTGYPLQTLLGLLWAHFIPIGSVAYRLNLLSACLAASALVLLYLASRKSGHTLVAAFFAPLLLGVSTIFWDQAILADKYALNATLLALVLFALVRWLKAASPDALALSALCYGLSLTHHRSMIVLAPFLLGLWIWRGRSSLAQPRFLAALLSPLLLYLWLPIGASRGLPPGTWHPGSLRGWISYLADQGFASRVRPDVEFISRLVFYVKTLLAQFTPLGIGLGLLGLIRQLRTRNVLVAVLLPGFLIQAVLTSGYQVPRHWVFFLPTFVLFSIWIAEGIDWLVHWLASARPPLRYIGLAAIVVMLAGAVGFAFTTNYPTFRENSLDGGANDLWRQDLKHGYTAERFAILSLAQAEPNSIIIGDWEQVTALWYKQQVEGLRPDLTMLYPIERWNEALATGRPTYLARHLAGVGEPYHLTSAGPLIRITTVPTTQIPADVKPLDYTWENQVSLVGYRYHQTDFRSGYVIPLSLYFRAPAVPVVDYSISLRLFDEKGNQVRAEDRSALAQGMLPASRTRPGEVVADYFEVPFPRKVPAGVYRLGIIMYTVQGGSFRNLLLADGAQIAYLSPLTIPVRR